MIMDFTDYFDRGAKGSLKLRNNTQLSHKGLEKQVYNNYRKDVKSQRKWRKKSEFKVQK